MTRIKTQERLTMALKPHGFFLRVSYASGWPKHPAVAWDVWHDDDDGETTISGGATESVDRLVQHLEAGEAREEFEQ